jgi:hypothetical protein
MQGQPGWHFWFIGFALTLALEAPWILVGLRSFETRRARRVLALLFANLATHPLVWYLFPALPLTRRHSLLGSELWAFAAEWLFYSSYIERLSFRRSALLSFAANGTSFLLGSLITRYFGAALFRW